MQRLSLLILLLLTTLPTFSQTVTTNKDTLVSVPLSQLRKAMYELQQFDVCKEEVQVQDSVIKNQHIKIVLQDSVIVLHVVKDSIQESQFKDCKNISTLKDEKIGILEHDISKYKKITLGTVVAAILGIIFL